MFSGQMKCSNLHTTTQFRNQIVIKAIWWLTGPMPRKESVNSEIYEDKTRKFPEYSIKPSDPLLYWTHCSNQESLNKVTKGINKPKIKIHRILIIITGVMCFDLFISRWIWLLTFFKNFINLSIIFNWAGLKCLNISFSIIIIWKNTKHF